MAETGALRSSVWIEPLDRPADFCGPIDTAYTPLTGGIERQLGLEDVERAAARFPEKIAIDDGEMRLTYQQVLDRTYGLARDLAKQLEPGVPIASLVHNSAAAPVIILAAAAAGLTLIPMDAGHPIERASALFEESGAKLLVLIDAEDVDDSFVPDDVPRLRFNCRAESGAPAFKSRPPPPGTPMFVVFTSGSTGRPKGVAYDRTDGLVRTVDAFHINPGDVILGLASLSTGGAGQAFLALTTGATLRLVDVKRAGISEVLRVMAEDGVTFLSFVPTVLRSLLALPGVEPSFRALRVLDLHGEATLQSDIALFRSKLPAQCHISITFSATETGPIFAWFVNERQFVGGSVPVGYLVPGKLAAILDEDGAPVGSGETGELFVRGFMAAGSWQRGRLTASRFFSDPDDPSRRIYRTGDLVRLRDDGLVEFVGRLDRQVKIRGLWADLSEVEAALREAPTVEDAVVTVYSRPGKPDGLAAFITLKPDSQAPALGDLRRQVRTATAEHMAPERIEILATIPRLANFKPDLVRLDTLLKNLESRS